MRLLYVSHSLPPHGRALSNVGGMQRVATELHGALSDHASVDTSSLLLRSSWRWTHVRVVPFMAKLLWQIPRRVQRENIDVVLFSSMVTASLAVPLRRRLQEMGVRTAAIVHGRDVTLPVAPYQQFVPYIFEALDAVLPVSRATAAQCLERGLPSDKLHVVPNGVDVRRFRPLEDAPTMRREMLHLLDDARQPLPDDALLLSSVGRQVERKGFAWFVDQVMPLLPEDVHYWLAGEGPEAENIEAAARKHGLEHRVRLLGRLPDAQLEALYRGADLFVMPNLPVPGDMEGFGVVMLEAGLSGLPTVAARLEGIQDVIAEGRNGHFVESGDARGFYEALMPYYHNCQDLQVEMQRTYQHVVETFSWEAVAGRYVDVLHTLVDTERVPVYPQRPVQEPALALARAES